MSLTGARGDIEFSGNCCSRRTTGQYAANLKWPDRPLPASPHEKPRAADLRVTQHTQSRSSSATSDPPSPRLKPNAFDCDTRCCANLNADGQGALGRRYDPDRMILGRACRNPATAEAKTPRISAEYSCGIMTAATCMADPAGKRPGIAPGTPGHDFTATGFRRNHFCYVACSATQLAWQALGSRGETSFKPMTISRPYSRSL